MKRRIGKYFELDDDGEVHIDFAQEFPEGTPIEVPAKWKKPPTLEERIKQFVRSERVAAALEKEGIESFDEADDFDVDEDPDPIPVGYAVNELVPEVPATPAPSPAKPEVAPEARPPEAGGSPGVDAGVAPAPAQS